MGKKKIGKKIFTIVVIVFFIILAALISLGIYITNNPEAIGEFFVNIVEIFKS